MTFVETLRQWDQAVSLAEQQDFVEALRVFLAIQEPNSKIYFDIGCLYIQKQDLEAAEKVCWSRDAKSHEMKLVNAITLFCNPANNYYTKMNDRALIRPFGYFFCLKLQVTVKEEVNLC